MAVVGSGGRLPLLLVVVLLRTGSGGARFGDDTTTVDADDDDTVVLGDRDKATKQAARSNSVSVCVGEGAALNVGEATGDTTVGGSATAAAFMA